MSLRSQRVRVLVNKEMYESSGQEAETRETRLRAIELDRTPQPHVGWLTTAMERRRVEMGSKQKSTIPMPKLVKKRK